MVERERHDRHRNLVVAATGTGKTVVAALDYRAAAERAAAISRCSSSRIASGFSSRVARRSGRSCVTDRLARSTAAAQLRRVAHVFAMIQSMSEETASPAGPASELRRRHRRRVPPRGGAELSAAARARRSGRTTGSDGHAGAHGRAGRDRVLRRANRGRATPMGGDRRGLPCPVSVLRRRGWHGSVQALRWQRGGYRAQRARQRGHRERSARREAAWRRSAGSIVEPAGDARAGLLRFGGARRVHGRALLPRPDSTRSRSRASRPDRAQRVRSAGSRPESCVRSSPSTFWAKVSTCRASTRCCSSGRRTARRSSLSSWAVACGAPDGKPYLTVIDLIGQQHRQFRFDRRLVALIDRRRGPLERHIEAGFPFLPSGRHVELDRQSEQRSCWETCATPHG